MSSTQPPRIPRILVGVLNIVGILLGLVGFLLLLIWSIHALGGRPELTIPFYGPQLQLAITDDGYITSWALASGEHNWLFFPAGAFEPVGGLLALLLGYVVLWRDKATARWFRHRSTTSEGIDAGSRLVSFEKAQIGKVEISAVAGRDIIIYKSPDHLEKELAKREEMLQRVENYWIKGLLEKSLYQKARVELRMNLAPEAVEQYPLDAVIQRPTRGSEQIPPEKPIVDVFNELGKALLILGAPGAGKTTLLLELARDLVVRARENKILPIPVVFALSTWEAEHKHLYEWLKEELHEQYKIPIAVATNWLDGYKILPLLDGLDEVGVEHREKCVAAINAFRKNGYGLVPIVICSRTEDYKLLTTKLALEEAVVIQPINPQQVDKYVAQSGSGFGPLHAALSDDPTLYELIDTPLMLYVAALAYKYHPSNDVLSMKTIAERRRVLFDTYIDAMFLRAGRSKKVVKHTQTQTISALIWLGWQMRQYKNTTFYIERMQRDWQELLTLSQQLQYVKRVKQMGGLITGIFAGIVGFILYLPVFGFVTSLIIGLICGLGLGLLMRSNFGGIRGDIDLGKRLVWRWSKVKLDMDDLGPFGCLIPLFIGITITTNGLAELPTRLLFLLVIVILLAATGKTAEGLVYEAVDTRNTPRQLIRYSAWSFLQGVLVGLLSGVVIGVLMGGFGLLILPVAASIEVGVRLVLLVPGLLLALVLGLSFGIENGGRAVIEHYTLRWLLFREGVLPFRDLFSWLDYCVDSLFLSRAGGGYRFVHGLLMEHFAEKYKKPTK